MHLVNPRPVRALQIRAAFLGLSLSALAPAAALAHGTLLEPMSRVYRVYRDNPETPTAPWARAALAVSGKQAFYTWNQVSQNIPSFNHRAVVPDGKLASGGNPDYAGIDLVRSDWPATAVAPGNYQLLFWATAAHEPSYFDVYITKASYDPSQPLTWDSMEPLGTHVPYWKDTPNHWRLNVTLPARTGKHVLWVVWQRIDPVGEVFFTASDVVFDGSVTTNPVVATPPADPTNPQNPPTPPVPPVPPVNNPPTPPTPPVPPTPGVITPPPASQTLTGGARVEFSADEAWASGYRATVRITNVGTTAFEGWKLSFTGPFVITSLWDARNLCDTSNAHSLVHPAWATGLAPGATATFGFVVTGAWQGPANVQFEGKTSAPPTPPTPPAPSANLAGSVRFDANWGSGFNATLRITNNGTTTVEGGWIAAFQAPFSIGSLWNGSYAKTAGVHTVRNASWNGRLAPGASVEIGFTGSGAAAPVAEILVQPATAP